MADLPVVAWRWDNSSPLCPNSWGITADIQRATMARDIALSVEALTPHAPAQAALEQARAEVERLTSAIRWALGEGGEFPVRMEGQGQYWWRTELRRRAALKSPTPGKDPA